MVRRGFTLIELAVVVTIIALLIAVLVPALVRVRNQAREAVCVQNLRTISLAWLMYKDDNSDNIVGGHAGRYPYDWVQSPTGDGDPIEREKEGIRQGALFIYVGDTVDVYRCPADLRGSVSVQTAFRSYSVAGGANGEGWKNSYTQARKYSELQGPASKYVFVEQADHRESNMGSWVMNPKTGTWVDPPAVWHSGIRSSLGFADGHTEVHAWVDRSTIEMCQNPEFLHPVPANEGQDIRFMLSGFPCKVGEGP